MTLQNCTPTEYTAAIDEARAAAIPGDLPEWATAEPLPTIAALRIEFANAEAEHAALLADGMDWETCGKPEAWACPPPQKAIQYACADCTGKRHGNFAWVGTCDKCGKHARVYKVLSGSECAK